ncbi:hypothetical protein CMUS01_07909 [Colletotrichum musicola]|uniref:Uncharacterized protein n=1 Tax=Colletotrichum musicola TaxID=2175873 RepID=A0A8H6KEP7_9PEZI|nr:hypothetical protein CMUS01_07909 [Colletotrichum musicola]
MIKKQLELPLVALREKIRDLRRKLKELQGKLPSTLSTLDRHEIATTLTGYFFKSPNTTFKGRPVLVPTKYTRGTYNCPIIKVYTNALTPLTIKTGTEVMKKLQVALHTKTKVDAIQLRFMRRTSLAASTPAREAPGAADKQDCLVAPWLAMEIVEGTTIPFAYSDLHSSVPCLIRDEVAAVRAGALYWLQYAEMLEYGRFVDCIESFTLHSEYSIPPYTEFCDILFPRLKPILQLTHVGRDAKPSFGRQDEAEGSRSPRQSSGGSLPTLADTIKIQDGLALVKDPVLGALSEQYSRTFHSEQFLLPTLAGNWYDRFGHDNLARPSYQDLLETCLTRENVQIVTDAIKEEPTDLDDDIFTEI